MSVPSFTISLFFQFSIRRKDPSSLPDWCSSLPVPTLSSPAFLSPEFLGSPSYWGKFTCYCISQYLFASLLSEHFSSLMFCERTSHSFSCLCFLLGSVVTICGFLLCTLKTHPFCSYCLNDGPFKNLLTCQIGDRNLRSTFESRIAKLKYTGGSQVPGSTLDKIEITVMKFQSLSLYPFLLI